MLKPPSDRFDTHEQTPSIVWFRQAHGSPFTINEALSGYKNIDVSEMDIQDMIAHACWAWEDEVDRITDLGLHGGDIDKLIDQIKIAREETAFWQSQRKAKT